MRKNKTKILVLGGTGLIGGEIVRKLAKYNSITVVSLGSQQDKEAFKTLKHDFPNLHHITGNIFLPTKYKNKTFNELVESDIFLEEYLDLLYINHNHKAYYLNKVIQSTQPNIVIDAVNSATILSYTKNVNLVKGYLKGKQIKLETLLATLSTPRLINYIDCLYQTLKETPSVETFLKVGTTGTGGMGFNIPYTHGEDKPSYTLLEKAAISGSYTSLLYLLSQTFGMPAIKEIKPAALVGYKKVGFGPIRTGGNPSSLRVFKYKQIETFNLTKLRKLDFDNYKFQIPKEGFRAVFVDTGENGQFSQEEFRTISNPRQMGFITKEEIATIVVKEVANRDTGKNIIKAFDKAVLGPSSFGQEKRLEVLRQMEKLLQKEDGESLAFEVLGPPRLAKLVFEAYLVKKYSNNFENISSEDISLIVSTGIPILLANKNLLVGKKPKIPVYGDEINNRNLDIWAEAGWVDLRKENLRVWEKRIREFDKAKKDFLIGDIVAWIFEKEDGGFRYSAR